MASWAQITHAETPAQRRGLCSRKIRGTLETPCSPHTHPCRTDQTVAASSALLVSLRSHSGQPRDSFSCQAPRGDPCLASTIATPNRYRGPYPQTPTIIRLVATTVELGRTDAIGRRSYPSDPARGLDGVWGCGPVVRDRVKLVPRKNIPSMAKVACILLQVRNVGGELVFQMLQPADHGSAMWQGRLGRSVCPASLASPAIIERANGRRVMCSLDLGV
ncbi:uncharacterized protein N7482_003668 [Penicillium canariense]|uniref:Uncharacterized protein n=1 Tax=Penicillium canariense TaxID=189055 RepID=A0A9W9I4Z2_9EURO|nr:uncharacterized protein N7482_003668 [Penicillium canariense]KAJ5168074.1 hypothetical protein N7482_003668 [Penicillium canariense]